MRNHLRGVEELHGKAKREHGQHDQQSHVLYSNATTCALIRKNWKWKSTQDLKAQALDRKSSDMTAQVVW